jgi:transcriptional regulator with XRE-family HTH domain
VAARYLPSNAGALLRRSRLERGISAAGLGRLAGPSRTHIHGLERGARPLRPINAALFLKALGVRGADLVEWGDLVETLVEEFDLEQLQVLNGIDPHYIEATA